MAAGGFGDGVADGGVVGEGGGGGGQWDCVRECVFVGYEGGRIDEARCDGQYLEYRCLTNTTFRFVTANYVIKISFHNPGT